MALESLNGAATNGLGADALPIFDVEKVQLQFSIAADFVAAQVANNVLILALSSGRILRIDLNHAEDIDDIDLPKKASETGVIRRMFLDPTASHLIICTSLGENYYLHSQSRQPRPLARLRGVSIESVAWNPALPTASTREILLGASDGNIYEAFIETSTEFYRKEERYFKSLQKIPDGPVTGLWVDTLPGGADSRRVVITTQSRIFHLAGKIGKGHDGGGSVYTKLFEAEQPVVHELSRTMNSATAHSVLAVSPDPDEAKEEADHDRAYGWLSAHGVYHGTLFRQAPSSDLGNKVFALSKMLSASQLASIANGSGRSTKGSASTHAIEVIALTEWHIVALVGSRVVAANRLTGKVVYDEVILERGQKAVSLCVDQQKNTFWLFTTQEVYEIVIRDEDRDIWKIMLQQGKFEAATKYAQSSKQKNAVLVAMGDDMIEHGQYTEAASVYGKSSKAFEEVALNLMENNQHDALRRYLLVKLASFPKASIMQRMMIATWLIEIFMAKLNDLDDMIVTNAELSETLDPAQTEKQLDAVRSEYQDFVVKYKSDLDKRTVYDIISSHGREEELLYFANVVNDYNFVLSYWVQRESWQEALAVLKRQTDPQVFSKFSSVLMTHVPNGLVDVLMRQPNLVPRDLVPALLEYDRIYKGPLAQNQAVRYLSYVVNQLNSTDAAIHNTLVSIYAAYPSKDESALLAYLELQGDEPRYDQDFALRLCIQNHRVLSCVHIYSSMGQYLAAVNLALSHDEIDLASIIADRPMSNPALRKKLWLAVAKKVISQSDGIKTAIKFLKRCDDLLRIEDLIPFFPDFVVIDDFKEEICGALEDYSRNIDHFKKEMDESSQTASNIKLDIASLDHRYAIVEPGEKCFVCGLPLLSRQFFVFPCQHAFHSDCLGKRVLEQAGVAKSRRIRECQIQISKGLVSGPKREAMIAELDSLVASACMLCSEDAIKRIDEPFIKPDDNTSEWAV